MLHLEWTLQILGLDLEPFYQILLGYSGKKFLQMIISSKNEPLFDLHIRKEQEFETICKHIKH
jgi:hypothetical protein